jgi:uncharacterized protein with PIN domain
MLGQRVLDELNECAPIERDQIVEYMMNEHRRALDSYAPNEEVRFCPKCNCALIKGSMSYLEGWHFDSCF